MEFWITTALAVVSIGVAAFLAWGNATPENREYMRRLLASLLAKAWIAFVLALSVWEVGSFTLGTGTPTRGEISLAIIYAIVFSLYLGLVNLGKRASTAGSEKRQLEERLKSLETKLAAMDSTPPKPSN